MLTGIAAAHAAAHAAARNTIPGRKGDTAVLNNPLERFLLQPTDQSARPPPTVSISRSGTRALNFIPTRGASCQSGKDLPTPSPARARHVRHHTADPPANPVEGWGVWGTRIRVLSENGLILTASNRHAEDINSGEGTWSVRFARKPRFARFRSRAWRKGFFECVVADSLLRVIYRPGCGARRSPERRPVEAEHSLVSRRGGFRPGKSLRADSRLSRLVRPEVAD
jgi:hypothetical protein